MEDDRSCAYVFVFAVTLLSELAPQGSWNGDGADWRPRRVLCVCLFEWLKCHLSDPRHDTFTLNNKQAAGLQPTQRAAIGSTPSEYRIKTVDKSQAAIYKEEN